MCMCTYGCLPQLLPVLFFERVSWRTWSSLILDSLASKPQESSCFVLLNAGVTGAWFYVGSVRTWFPCLHSKHLSFSLSCCFLITTKAWLWRGAQEGSSQGRGLTTRWNFPPQPPYQFSYPYPRPLTIIPELVPSSHLSLSFSLTQILHHPGWCQGLCPCSTLGPETMTPCPPNISIHAHTHTKPGHLYCHLWSLNSPLQGLLLPGFPSFPTCPITNKHVHLPGAPVTKTFPSSHSTQQDKCASVLPFGEKNDADAGWWMLGFTK